MTRLPLTIGDDTPRPASGAFHATFSVALHFSGSFVSGVVPVPGPERHGNGFGFVRIDHLTANFQTMKPALLWMQHVLGFEPFWEIAFHTNDVAAAERREHGSGLKSVVMWDPVSGVKFANNEPFRPFFKESQINLFAEDNRGDGVQRAGRETGDSWIGHQSAVVSTTAV